MQHTASTAIFYQFDIHMPQITRRYAEFSAALVGISESFPSDLVTQLLAELQEEVEYFIIHMAAAFPQRKEQLIFLINNYDMVLGILMVRRSVQAFHYTYIQDVAS
jgi:hypothetical protein